jgi:ATP-binding cassette subfamily B protein
VQGFAREAFDRQRFAGYSLRHLHKNLALVRVRALFAPSLDLMLGLATVLVLVFGGMEVVRGTMTLGTFVAFLFLFGYLTGPMVGFGWSVSLFQRGRASLRRIDRFLAEPVEIPDRDDAVDAPSGALVVRGLTFAYSTPPPAEGDPSADDAPPRPLRDGPVLEDVSFELQPGRTLGVVGRVGSGKSTLASLLVRMYEPPAGSITIGGVDIRNVTQDSLRSRIVVAPQETFLFSDTLERNIAVGGATTREDVERCVRLAGLGPDIEDLALGLDTLVGERGVNLSGGQRQRVTIARAIATSPDILVLDDCLSAVDARTEAAVLANLRQVFAGRSGIVISHRIAAVRDCDEILVLENGRVIEHGSHAALIAADGFYARMAQAQASEVIG